MAITLYDVPGRDGKSWFPMIYRNVLNYKGITFETVWVEYPDIEPTMRKIGAAPTGSKLDGTPYYTVPAENRRLCDSWTIAIYLDEKYPTEPTLFPAGTHALQALFQERLMKTVQTSLHFATVLIIHQNLSERSAIGSKDWKDAWDKAEKDLTDLSNLLAKNGSNAPFVMGNTITYTDFILASVLESFVKFVPDEWDSKVRHWDGGKWGAILENWNRLAI
ncbi:hypothetical protein BU17DRAFT_72308 [Hysterangium stoloniferum]|nr:hypothetical protein BU17DRAFT_72308 [Hysterangium stoloniferum]